ncbi:MAG: dihydrodipicolinate synthase family protein, partial [Clostridia bacterium]|nr:dihydrodipicolinate synthase family protein [Clostridia bacterium]
MKKSKKEVFCGAATALITPFKHGLIDYIALERLIERQIEAGIDALLINGTTGESSTLTNEERKEMISFAVKVIDGRVPTLAGTGCNITENALELSKFACDAGCDAVLVVTPYYNKA